MSSTLEYTRKFIILKKEFSTIKGISPKGHGKLQVKGLRGMVTVNIENAEKDNFYNVSFISNDRINPIWNLGKIFTDDIGRGKGEYVFIQRDLESKNFFMDKIAGIIITRDDEILLGGYIDKENGCIERYIRSMQNNLEVIEPTNDPIYDVPAAEITEDLVHDIPETEMTEDLVYDIPETEPTNDPIYDVPATEMAHDPIYDTPAVEPTYEPINDFLITEPEPDLWVEEVVDLVPEEALIVEIVEELVPEEVAERVILDHEFDPYDFDEESMEQDYKTLDYIRKINQKDQTTNYVLSILRFFPYIDPFQHPLKGYNWWIVELDKENEYRSFLPYFSYLSGGNTKEPYASNITTCNQMMNKYGHYLFGLYNEGEKVKYFVYGVPGSFTQDEHPYRGTNGFNIWYPGKSTGGYWIIFIDPMTGKPVDISVPMVPID